MNRTDSLKLLRLVAAALLLTSYLHAPLPVSANNFGDNPEIAGEDEPKTEPSGPRPCEDDPCCPDGCCPAGSGSSAGDGESGANSKPSTKEEPGNQSASDPVDIFTGRFFTVDTDLVVNGVNPIRIVRRYNSQSEYDSPLGYGWSLNYDMRLFEYPDDSVVVRTMCGILDRYQLSGTTYTLDEPERGRAPELKGDGSQGHVLTYSTGRTAHFDSHGRLTKLANPDGNALEFEYEASGKKKLVGMSNFALDPTQPVVVAYVWQLTRVKERPASLGSSDPNDSPRHYVDFSYNPGTGRLSSIVSNDLRQVTYVHDDDPNSTTGNLDRVDGLANIVQTYFYDPPEAHNVTSFRIAAGMALHVNTYTDERVTRQTIGAVYSGPTLIGGVAFDFAYPTDVTRVVTRTWFDEFDGFGAGINPRQAITKYNFNAEGFLIDREDPDGTYTEYVRGDPLDPEGGAEDEAPRHIDRIVTYASRGGTQEREVVLDHDASGNLKFRQVDITQGGAVHRIEESWDYVGGWVSRHEFSSNEGPDFTDAPDQLFRTEYDFDITDPVHVDAVRRLISTGPDVFETTSFLYNADGQLWKTIPPEADPGTPVGLEIVREYFPLTDLISPGLLQRIYLQVDDGMAGKVKDDHLERSFVYDVRGFLSTVTDAEGNATLFGFDNRGRVTSVTTPNPLLETTSFTYTGPNDFSSTDDPTNWGGGPYLTRVEVGTTAGEALGQVRIFRYDDMGYLVGIERKTDPPASTLATFVSFSNDTVGNRLMSTDAVSREFTFAYDKLDRLLTVTDENAAQTVFAYDAFGNRKTVTDALNQISRFSFDGLNRLSTVTVEGLAQELSLLTTFEYDAVGNVTKVIDPRSKETTYAYDLRSRLDSVTPPLGAAHTVSYCYDELGRLAGVLNARGQALDYDYFAWGGLENVKHYDLPSTLCGDRSAETPSPTISYTYDDNGSIETVSDDSLGGLLYTFSWDQLDRLDTAVAHYLPAAVTDPVLDSGYDRYGNRDSLDYREGPSLIESHSWPYDYRNRLERATFQDATPTVSSVAFLYYDNDELQTLTHGNLATTTYMYKAHGPIQSIGVQFSGNSLHLLDYVSHDANRNIKTIRESIALEPALTPDYVYDYDGASRLSSASYPSYLTLPLTAEAFGYDDAGNRDDNPEVASPWSYDDNDRVQSSPGSPSDVSYVFDDDGNMESRSDNLATRTLTWDAVNRLDQVVDSVTGTTTYAYDPFGRRIKKTSGGTTTWYLWDGDQLLAEYDGAGVRKVRYAYAGGFAPIQVAYDNGAGEDVYDVHTDHLDTPRMLTDGSGTPVWRAAYEAFGTAHVDTAGNTLTHDFNIRFPGQYYDAEKTGLHYNRFRYYDPSIGRYISADPLGQLGGVNLYRYAANSPVNLVDPTGEVPALVIAAVAVAVVVLHVALNTEAGREAAKGMIDAAAGVLVGSAVPQAGLALCETQREACTADAASCSDDAAGKAAQCAAEHAQCVASQGRNLTRPRGPDGVTPSDRARGNVPSARDNFARGRGKKID